MPRHHVTARVVALCAVTLVVCTSISVQASPGVFCCPSCTANNGECYTINEVFGSFAKGGPCLDACPGSCIKSSPSTYVCGLEGCGPLQCPKAAPQSSRNLRASHVEDTDGFAGRRLTAEVGTCVAGRNTTGMPLRGAPGWWGDYAYHVTLARTKAALEQVTVATGWEQPPDTMGMQVANGGNTLYWPEQFQQQWTLRGRTDELIVYNFSLGQQAYAKSFAASDEVILTGEFRDGVQHWLSYDAQHPPSTVISDVTSIPHVSGGTPPQLFVEGTTVYVLVPSGDTDFILYHWQAYFPDTVYNVTITVAGCNIAGSKDQAITLSTAAVKGGTFMFTAYDPYGDQVYQLCTTDLTTGVTTPLLPDLPSYPRAYTSAEVSFFDNAVLYTSVGGKVDTGDSVACLVSDPSAGGKARCHWLNDELQQSSYLFTKLYTGYHMPAPVTGPARWAIYKDVVVYRTYAEVDNYSMFGYNLTSGDVYPIALVYDIPNTQCNMYTGDNSANLAEFSFIEAFMMANGTAVFGVQHSHMSNVLNSVVSVTSPLLRGDVVGCAGGCALHGGACIAGTCHCMPGCSGSDCREGGAYCNPAPPAQDDDF